MIHNTMMITSWYFYCPATVGKTLTSERSAMTAILLQPGDHSHRHCGREHPHYWRFSSDTDFTIILASRSDDTFTNGSLQQWQLAATSLDAPHCTDQPSPHPPPRKFNPRPPNQVFPGQIYWTECHLYPHQQLLTSSRGSLTTPRAPLRASSPSLSAIGIGSNPRGSKGRPPPGRSSPLGNLARSVGNTFSCCCQ